MIEETCSHGLADGLEILLSSVLFLDWQLKPVGDLYELLLRVECALQGAALDEVVEAPCC